MGLISLGAEGGLVEDVALSKIAQEFSTPCYVYSRTALEAAYFAYRSALEQHGLSERSLICYAVKANSNIAVLNLFARLGAGFDIVSGGELARVMAAGGDASKVVFSGVAKSDEDMRIALRLGIHCFNVESVSELHTLNRIAGQLGLSAPISLRVNPDVDAKTHPYISTGLKSNKFGIAFGDAHAVYRLAATLPNLRITGIDCHIGSQLLDPAPAAEATDKLIALVDALAKDDIRLQHIDVGGGMGITYQADEPAPAAQDYLAPILSRLATRSEHVIMEPGRSLVGNAGLLLTRVCVIKHGETKNFAIVDAAMNDLMRPALYDAWHDIVKVSRCDTAPETAIYDVVGPVCESGDFIGQDRSLAIAEGDLLAALSAGAYGMSMASNYNTRPRAAEVMVDGHQCHLIRKRERVEDLFALEQLLP